MLLLGDAAGLVSPLTGEGIPYAMQSGIKGADCAIKYFEDQTSLIESYTRAIDPITEEINNYGLTLQNKLFGSDLHRKNIIKRCYSNAN